jgi:hypothetical protein
MKPDWGDKSSLNAQFLLVKSTEFLAWLAGQPEFPYFITFLTGSTQP